jgi:hypothetical protein
MFGATRSRVIDRQTQDQVKHLREQSLAMRILLAACVVVALGIQSYARDVCVPPTLTISSISGRVIAMSSIGEEPFAGAKVTLRGRESDGPIIAKRTTNRAGRFSFDRVSPGKYVIIVEARLFISFMFPVQLRKQPQEPSSHNEIVVNLGVNHNASCGGGFVELRERRLAPIAYDASKLPTVNFCELVQHPELYDGKQIRISAIYRLGYEWSDLYCSGCYSAEKMVLLEFEDEFESRTEPRIVKSLSDFEGTYAITLIGQFRDSGGR